MGAAGIRWARDGKSLDYRLTRGGASNIGRQALVGGPPRQLSNFQSDLIFSFNWSRDGEQLALARGATSSNVMLIRNFQWANLCHRRPSGQPIEVSPITRHHGVVFSNADSR